MLRVGGRSNPSRSYPTRVHEMWPSDGNIILCWGLFITGRQPILLAIAILCAVFPYYSFISNSTSEDLASNAFSVAFLTIWLIITLLVMLRIALCDPGIIPRRKLAEQMEGNRANIDPYADVPGAVRCVTCEIHRPPNAAHCSDCNNCVVGFDHHCAVLNNCIGQRNYPYFFALLPSTLMLVISFLFQIKFPSSSAESSPSSESAIVSVIKGLSMTVAVGALIFVLGLIGYHIYLLVFGLTTKQHLRRMQPHANLSAWDRLRGMDSQFNLRQFVFLRDGFSQV